MFPAGLVEQEGRWAEKVRLEKLEDAAAWMWVTADWLNGPFTGAAGCSRQSGRASWLQLPNSQLPPQRTGCHTKPSRLTAG